MARGEYLYNIGSMPRKISAGQGNLVASILRNLPTSTPSAGFQRAAMDLEAYRRRNPIYIPFAAGTPTQSRREMIQEREMFEKEHELDLRKQAEIERQNRIAESLSRARAASGGGGTSSGGLSGITPPSTKEERQNLAAALLTEEALKRLEYNKQRFGREGRGDDPLFWTLQQIMTDPEWITTARASGVDMSKVADALVISENQYPEQYFSPDHPTGKALLPYYNRLTGTQGYKINEEDTAAELRKLLNMEE